MKNQLKTINTAKSDFSRRDAKLSEIIIIYSSLIHQTCNKINKINDCCELKRTKQKLNVTYYYKICIKNMVNCNSIRTIFNYINDCSLKKILTEAVEIIIK